MPRTRKHLLNYEWIIPDEFSGDPWYKKLWNKLLVEHDWICIILPYNPDRDFVAVRWSNAMVKIVNFLFIDTVLSTLFMNDNGKCELHLAPNQCTEQVSLDQINTLCAWSEVDGCAFNSKIGETFASAMIMTAIITTISCPFDKTFHRSILNIRDLIAEKYFYKETQRFDNANTKEVIYHELHDLQTRPTTLLRAARLVKMQQQMDDLSESEEVDVMLTNFVEAYDDYALKNINEFR